MAATDEGGDWGRAVADALEPGMGERLTLTRAITLLSWHFLHGAALTTAQVACMTGRSQSGAYRLLCEMSGAMPLVLYRRRWQLESMLEPE